MSFTIATLDYTLSVKSPAIPSIIRTLLASAPLDFSILANYGCSLTSDVTTLTTSTTVRRRIIVSFFPTPNLFPVVSPELAAFRGAIVSSSANDKRGGSGLQRARIEYTGTNGKNYEDVDMNGLVPVQLLSPKKLSNLVILPIEGSAAGLIAVNNGSIVNGCTSGDRVGLVLNNFAGSILSTSHYDSEVVSGIIVSFNYTDASSGSHSGTVHPAGTSPVVLPGTDHALFTSVTTSIPNVGTVTIYTGLHGDGAPAAQIPPSLYAYFPDGTDQTIPFRDLFTHTLSQAVGSTISAAAPVLS